LLQARTCNFLFFSGGPREFRTFVFIYSFFTEEYGRRGRVVLLYNVKCVPAQEAGTFADVQLDGGVYTMFIGYSLQATLEQINRKGLLQGRIEDVRVYSGQGMRRTCTLPPRWPHRSVRGYFLISLPFFSRTRYYYRRGCPSTIRTQPRYGIRSFLDSRLAELRGARCIQSNVNSRRNSMRDCSNCLCTVRS